MSPAPFFIIHYTPNVDRKRYLDDAFAKTSIAPRYVTEFDRDGIRFDEIYRYDEARFRELLTPIKDILIGYVIGIFNQKTAPWANCVLQQQRRNSSLDADLQASPWLRPRPLRPAEISVFLKHRAAWQRIAEADCEWGIIAEDDILFHEQTAAMLQRLAGMLPPDFDYVDLAGGCGMLPRMGNAVVNECFFAIEPPNTRTACCALMKRSLARRLVELALPICMPVDWTLTHALTRERAKVFWMHPPIFVHGSETNFYKSGTAASVAPVPPSR